MLHRKSERGQSGQKLLIVIAIGTLLAQLSSRAFAAEIAATNQNGISSNNPTMDARARANAFHAVLRKMAAGERPDPKLWDEFVAAQNEDLKTGPQVGQKVPDFTLPDQFGRQHSLQSLMGKHGLLLVFNRSADW